MTQTTQNLSNSLNKARQNIADDEIAAALGGDATTVSRVFSDQYGVKLSRIEAFLAALGYRAIPIAAKVREVPESDYQSLVTMAGIGQQALATGGVHPRHAARPDGGPERRRGERRGRG